MQILAPVLYTILITAIIYRWRFFHLENIPHRWMTSAFLLKVLVGILFWIVYTFYYTDPSESDALRYFQDSMTIRDLWSQNREIFWSFMLGRNMDSPEYAKVYDQLIAWTSGYRYGLSNDCSTIIRINVLISFISFKSFHVHAILLSFMSFLGFTAIFRSMESLFNGRKRILFICCFLLPSVVFWSSSLLKEAPLFMCFGFMLLSVVRILQDRTNYIFYILLLFSSLLLVYIKVYVLISIVPGILFLLVLHLTGRRFILPKFLATHVICFCLVQQAHHYFRGGDFLYVLHKKQVDFQNVALLTDAGSVVEIPPVSTVGNFIIHYPEAFFLTYFRPHVFEAKSPVYFFFALENAAYLLLVLFTILYFRKPLPKNLALILCLVSYVIVLASILGNCVPILGAMVRYKVPGLIILVIICFALMDSSGFVSRLRRNQG